MKPAWKLSFTIAILVMGIMLLSSISSTARISPTISSAPSSKGIVNSPISTSPIATGNGCVITVPSGSTVGSTSVTFADGSVHQYGPGTCGLKDSSTIVTVPTINGWVESATDYTGFSAISGTWTVPPAPTTIASGSNNGQGQVVFLFNSIDGYTTYYGSPYYYWIIQPVLTWGCTQSSSLGCSFGRQGWWIDVWIVWSGGNGSCGYCNTIVSNEIDVSPGDQINGYINSVYVQYACGSPTYKYSINVVDTTTNNSEGLGFCQGGANGNSNQGDAGALEAYYVDTCSELPAADSMAFQSITSTPAQTSWGHSFYGANPSCNYQITSNSNSASLYFGPTIEIYTYSVNDNYCRSVGLAFDQALPVPWWPPYQSGFQISPSGGVCGSFTYYTTPTLTPGSHYLQTAVSGFVSNYEWYTKVYINGNLAGQGYVGRNQILQVNFNV